MIWSKDRIYYNQDHIGWSWSVFSVSLVPEPKLQDSRFKSCLRTSLNKGYVIRTQNRSRNWNSDIASLRIGTGIKILASDLIHTVLLFLHLKSQNRNWNQAPGLNRIRTGFGKIRIGNLWSWYRSRSFCEKPKMIWSLEQIFLRSLWYPFS